MALFSVPLEYLLSKRDFVSIWKQESSCLSWSREEVSCHHAVEPPALDAEPGPNIFVVTDCLSSASLKMSSEAKEDFLSPRGCASRIGSELPTFFGWWHWSPPASTRLLMKQRKIPVTTKISRNIFCRENRLPIPLFWLVTLVSSLLQSRKWGEPIQNITLKFVWWIESVNKFIRSDLKVNIDRCTIVNLIDGMQDEGKTRRGRAGYRR